MPRKPSWEISEDCVVRVEKEASVVALARLSQFADKTTDGWRITAASIRRAKSRGITLTQIQEWIKNHELTPTPRLTGLAIQNWFGAKSVLSTGTVVLLRVADPVAYSAILNSERFKPLIADRLSPPWILIRKEDQVVAQRLLKEIGYTVETDLFRASERTGI